MKAGKNSTSKLSLLLTAVVIFVVTTTFSQTGKVWTSVNDFKGLALTIGADKTVSSQNTEINAILTGLQITSIEKAFPASRSIELAKVYEISCNCNENDLLRQISSNGKFFHKTELAPTYTLLDTPNDYNTAFASDYALDLINAEAAWDVTHGDSSIVLAITDANYYSSHEELAGKYNYITPNNFNSNYTHGTATAITAAGNTNNSLGKSSIGYNSTLQLRAMNYNEVLEASYAGARVVNMSWASGCFFNSYAQDIMNEAHANGTILVASAGNGSTCGGPENLVYPAAFDHVFAVSSVGPYDNHERSMGNPTTTHQHNASVDICAPGYDVALSTAPGAYLTGNGSSFAAPFVTGTIGLMLAVNPCLTSSDIEYILKATAVNIDAVNATYIGKLGAGRLDAGAAVLMASTFSTMALNGENTFSCTTMEQGINLDLSTVTAPFQITWNTGSSAQNLVNVAPGTYSAIVRDSSGCIGYYTTLIDTLAPITIAADIFAVNCYGENSGNIEIEVAGGHSNYTFLWSNEATTQNLYGIAAGNYSVTVTDEKGCRLDESFDVNQPNALFATVSHQNVTPYQSGSINVTVMGGNSLNTFSWSNGAQTEDITGLAIGFYEVLITDAKGCLASANATIGNTQIDFQGNNGNVAAFNNGSTNSENTTESNSTSQETSLGLNENNNATAVVYPNPATDFTNVTWEGLQIEQVQLFDMTGKVIQTMEITPFTSNVVISGVSQGEYMVRLNTAAGEVVVKKVSFL